MFAVWRKLFLAGLLLATPELLFGATMGDRNPVGVWPGAGTLRSQSWPSLQAMPPGARTPPAVAGPAPAGTMRSFSGGSLQPPGRGIAPAMPGPRGAFRGPAPFFGPMSGRWTFRPFPPRFHNPRFFHRFRPGFFPFFPFAGSFFNPFLPFFAYNPFCFFPSSNLYWNPAFPWGSAYPWSSGYMPSAWSGPSSSYVYVPPADYGEDAGQPPPVENLSVDPNRFAEQGEAAFRARDYDGAARAWRHAIVDDPSNGELMLQLAQALFATGRYEEAAGATQQALMLLPPENWRAAAGSSLKLYQDPEDYRGQVAKLEEAVKNNPNNPGLRMELGFQYGYSGRPGDAAAQLDKLLEVAPQDQVGRTLRNFFTGKAG